MIGLNLSPVNSCRTREPFRKPFEIACPEVYIRVHFWTRVFAEQKRRRCVKPRTSLSVLKLQGANKNKAETYLRYVEDFQ